MNTLCWESTIIPKVKTVDALFVGLNFVQKRKTKEYHGIGMGVIGLRPLNKLL